MSAARGVRPRRPSAAGNLCTPRAAAGLAPSAELMAAPRGRAPWPRSAWERRAVPVT